MGAAGRAWFPSHFSSIMLAGYGCVGMGHAGFLGKWGGREGEVSGKRFKIFFSPVSAFAGEKKLHCAVQNGTVQFFFFFLKKRKKI